MLSPGQRETYYNYDQFMKTGASLIVAFVLIDDDYELGKFELPPHILEFDLGGALIFENNTAMLEGGEVKSFIPLVLPNHAANSFISEFRVAEGQLFRCFIPQIHGSDNGFVLKIIDERIRRASRRVDHRRGVIVSWDVRTCVS